MLLNDITPWDLAAGLLRPASALSRDPDGRYVCRVQATTWVPDGLSLAGYPGVASALLDLSDYPTFTLEAPPLPDAGTGVAAMQGYAQWLQAIADEVVVRCRTVAEEVAELRAEVERTRPATWYITDFDPLRQILRTTGDTLEVVTFPRTGARADVRRLFLLPYLTRPRSAQASPDSSRRERLLGRGAYVESAVRGGHSITIRSGKRHGLTVDLLTGAVIRKPASVK